jgi:hypothetical protein
MEIKGKIIEVGDIQEFSSGFRKRTVVVDDGDKYPNPVPVEVVKEKADDFDGKAGDIVRMDINIRGREWNGRYFANIQGWRWDLERFDGPSEQESEPSPGQGPNADNDEEEVPF